MTSVLTCPSLAFLIYKTHYIPRVRKDAEGNIINAEELIYQLLGPIEADIRQAYTGGHVDMYLAHNYTEVEGTLTPPTQDLYYYDVNSLYPTVMAQHLMPVGLPVKFEGDILAFEPDAFGFFNVEVSTKSASPNINEPILQCHYETSTKSGDGIRTVAGLGT
jgi:hypothetical protein